MSVEICLPGDLQPWLERCGLSGFQPHTVGSACCALGEGGKMQCLGLKAGRKQSPRLGCRSRGRAEARQERRQKHL